MTEKEERNIVQYANGFSITVNKESEEMVITFTQSQPIFDEKDSGFKSVPPREVCSVIFSYNLGIKLKDVISKAVADQASSSEKE